MGSEASNAPTVLAAVSIIAPADAPPSFKYNIGIDTIVKSHPTNELEKSQSLYKAQRGHFIALQVLVPLLKTIEITNERELHFSGALAYRIDVRTQYSMIKPAL